MPVTQTQRNAETLQAKGSDRGQRLPGRNEFKERDGSHRFVRGKPTLKKV